MAESIRDGCITPSVGLGMPALALTVIGAVLLLTPSFVRAARARPIQSLAWTAMGALDGMVAYWFLRPTSFTGPTTAGDVITVPLPFDVWALAAVGIAGAGIGWLVGGWVVRRRILTLVGTGLAPVSAFGIMAG